MIKKLLSMVTLTALLFTIAAVMPAAATGTETILWPQNGLAESFEGETYAGTATSLIPNPENTSELITNQGYVPIGTTGGQSGNNYLQLPGAHDSYTINFVPGKEGMDQNYILTFWAKTSVGESLHVETSPINATNGWKDWSTYCKENGIEFIHTGEGKAYLNTGATNAENWFKNTMEFRVPHDCTNISIVFSTQNGEDPSRAIDNISITKTKYNLLKNGGFDGIQYGADGTKKMQHAFWWTSSGESFTLNEKNGNTYLSASGSVWGKGPLVYQTVYLYEGKYKLSFDMEMKNTRSTLPIKFYTDTVPYSNLGEGGVANLLGRSALPTGTFNDNKTYSIYFDVYTSNAFNLYIGNSSYYGTFNFDNITITPINEINGSLEFGTVTVNYKDPTAGKAGGDEQWEFVPATGETGEKIQAFGLIPTDGVATTAQVLTSVYKVSANGNRVLAEVKIDSAVPGQGFKGSEVTIPTLASGEKAEVKAMVLNSLGELKAFGKDFILE